MSGVDKYISLFTHISPTRILLISSLNPVNVSSDWIRSAHVIHALDNPDKLVFLPFQPVSFSRDFSQLSNPTNHSLTPALSLVTPADFRSPYAFRTFEFHMFSLSLFLFLYHSRVFISPPFRSSLLQFVAIAIPGIICRSQMERTIRVVIRIRVSHPPDSNPICLQ